VTGSLTQDILRRGPADLLATVSCQGQTPLAPHFEHRHSGIRYVTPAQRHAGQDRDILMARHDLYIKAKESKPSRWSGNTRDWTPVGAVTLNPEREAVVSTAALEAENKTQEVSAGSALDTVRIPGDCDRHSDLIATAIPA